MVFDQNETPQKEHTGSMMPLGTVFIVSRVEGTCRQRQQGIASALFVLYNAIMPRGERKSEKSHEVGRTGNALKTWPWRSLMKMSDT